MPFNKVVKILFWFDIAYDVCTFWQGYKAYKLLYIAFCAPHIMYVMTDEAKGLEQYNSD